MQLAQGLAFDLADPLARNRKNLAHFRERVGVAVGKSVAKPDDLALPIVQRPQGLGDAALQRIAVDAVQRVVAALVGQEVAEIVLSLVAQRLVEREHAAVGPHARPVAVSDKPAALAVSSIVGRPLRVCVICRPASNTRSTVPSMWMGMRIVRLWSAIERLIAWRIHQVA